jgi:multidrug resistance protein
VSDDFLQRIHGMSLTDATRSSFSETAGRRTIYLISFALFVLFSVLSAVSVNISMLIVMRMLGGGAAASVQAVGAGTIADIWEPAQRGRAMGLFYLGPLTGPLFAPIIGGGLSQAFGWRSTMWFLVVYGGVTLMALFVCLPETLPRRKALETQDSEVLARTNTASQSIKDRTKKAGDIFKRTIIDPLRVLAYLRFPAVLVTVYQASIAFGVLFFMNISIQSSFASAPYGFSEVIVGLLYVSPSLGYFLSSLVSGPWVDRIMAREARKAGRYDENGKLVYLPEDRMRENMWLGACLYPLALILYGWTIDKGLYWIIPCIGTFLFGLGSMIVFGTVTTMLTEFMPKKSSSGVAVNNFVRNIFSSVGAVVAQPLINALGNGWIFTIVGLFAFITGNLAILALRRWAPEWRKKMDKELSSSSN